MTPQISSPVLVGRAAEVATLERLIAGTAEGTPGLAVLSGEAGIGKTRLVARATELAQERGLQVMTGHCVQLGTEGLAYAPIVEALRELTRTAGDELEAVLGPARDLVLRLTTGAGADSGQLTGTQILELVLGVIERVASLRPLLLVLEDLHWSDRSTLELAAFLAQNLRGVPVLLLFTYRSDEVDRRHPLRQLQASWERARTGTRIELRRFDRDDVHDLLRSILGTEPSADTLALVYERSEGNVFLAEEMLSAVSSGDARGLPSSLRDLLLARLDQLTPATEEVLRLAAIAGRSVPERLLVAASGLPETEVLGAIREAVDAHLLVVNEADHGYRFRHALTRDAVYDDLLPGERVRLHAQYADALAGDPGLVADTTLSTAAELAHHAYASLDLPRALAASVTAGAEAAAQFAPHEALAQYERALLLWPRVAAEQLPSGPDAPDQVEVMRLAAVAAYNAGELERSLALDTEALALLPTGEGPERRVAITLEYTRSMRDLGRNREAGELLQQALPLLPPGDSELRAALEAELATLLMRQFDTAAVDDHAARAVAAARAVGSARIEADALVTRGAAASLRGDAAAPAMLQEGMRRAIEAGDPYILMRAFVNLSDGLELLGRSREAAAAAESGIVAAEQSGMLRTIGTYLIGNLAESLLHLGEWKRAEGLLDEALQRLPTGVFETAAQGTRAELAILTGDRAAAAEAIRRSHMALPDDAQFQVPLVYLEAELARVERDHPRVLDLVRDVLRTPVGDDEAQLLRYTWPVAWVAARSEAERRAVDGAPLDAEVVDFVARLAAPTPPAAGWRALSQAEIAGADPALWLDAAEVWRGVEWPWQLAYAQLRCAESCVERGDNVAAEAPLREAFAIAQRLGAVPLLDEARLLARRARIPLGDAAPETPLDGTGVDPLARYGLTAREREVLLLLAEGESNPGIAERLFISPKTASVHVSNILGKLGVEGRVQAAGLVHRLGVLGS